MKFNIRQIEAFRAVVAMQSMRKASELLGISQPAVSRLIGDLQKAVDMKLFTRTRNGVVPTPDARLLSEQVEKLFVGFEELGRQLSAIKNLQEGSLVIAATSSYSIGLLPQIIADFKRDFPAISISLHILKHDEVVDWVVAGRADIGLTSQQVSNSAVQTTLLKQKNLVCVFPEGHRFEEMERLTPKDFEGEPFISFPMGSATRYQIDRLFDLAGVDRLQSTDATSHHAVCALVHAGLGVSLVNPFAPFSPDGTALSTREVTPSVPLELNMVLKDFDRSTVAEAFQKFLAEEAPRRLDALLGT